MNPVRVLIVDDHAIVRSGLRMLISAQPDMTVAGEAGTLAEAIERAPSAQPHVITLDLSMPGSQAMAGIPRLKAVAPEAAVLVLTMHDDPAFVRSALAMGAAGYVVKSAADAELITAIRTVARGGMFVDMQSAAPIGQTVRRSETEPGRTALDSLSAREREVFIEVANGYTNQQIADRSGVSVKTIESYRARLMTKLGLKSRADLTRLAVESGVLKPADGPA